MASALDALAEGVMIAEADRDAAGSVIVYVNPAWERMTGYAAAEAVGGTAAGTPRATRARFRADTTEFAVAFREAL